jgi:hypothetical protein
LSPGHEGATVVIRGLLAVHVWIVAAAIPLLDKLLTPERMLRLLTPRRPFGPYVGQRPSLIAGMVHRRLRRPIHMRRRACLRLSLVLYHFLRLSGAEAIFHVAVFPPSVDPRRLHAHSWVTVGETCLCEPPQAHAAEILTYGT